MASFALSPDDDLRRSPPVLDQSKRRALTLKRQREAIDEDNSEKRARRIEVLKRDLEHVTDEQVTIARTRYSARDQSWAGVAVEPPPPSSSSLSSSSGLDSNLHDENDNEAEAAAANEDIDELHDASYNPFVHNLQQPEWMTSLPEDLGPNWTVVAKPEGQRVLIFAHNGRTIARLRNGRVMNRFASPLPGGSPQNKRQDYSQSTLTILDCIFYEPSKTFYVMDVVNWNGVFMNNCDVAFRFFFLFTKIAEMNDSLGEDTHSKFRFKFESIPFFQCGLHGLNQAYSGSLPYARDGLIFLVTKGQYFPGEHTPLALLWKDAQSSAYSVDTNADGSIAQRQAVVLRLSSDMESLETEDGVVLTRLPQVELSERCDHREGSLFRLRVNDGGFDVSESNVTTADLTLEAPVSKRRGRADSFSKIMYQYMARRSPIRIEDIRSRIESNVDADADFDQGAESE